ncbi:hypothetical protein ACHHYP_05303 [Achlya hypogyna]|uniref:Uncharacterized protein n=1 Tax=Achlya hypogyna TaxID=1202772 RepID=A0A1V9YY25_ACHHY|nr:hypothetical protein ACHHYP_05303 [Achlya hypogyna]
MNTSFRHAARAWRRIGASAGRRMTTEADAKANADYMKYHERYWGPSRGHGRVLFLTVGAFVGGYFVGSGGNGHHWHTTEQVRHLRDETRDLKFRVDDIQRQLATKSS